MENVTQQLANTVARIEFNDLPKEVVSKTKLMLLDSVGCALGSYVTDRARIAVQLVEELGGTPQASIIGGHRTSYSSASFANAELINALDYDYNGPLVGHVCPYVTPPCLSIAEREHASGKDLILALALAHEIGGRMVNSLAQQKVPKNEPPYYEESLRFSYTSSVFGGVAGASKLLRLDVDELQNAFGIAGASTAVPAGKKWEYTEGAAVMLKYGAWAGWIAQLATVASLLALKGFTGDTTILDGEWGFWQIVGSPFFKIDNLLKGLGEVWHTNQVKFKRYPNCLCNHDGINGILHIMEKYEIRPGEIEEIVIKGDPLLLRPMRIGTEIRSYVDTQFVLAYSFGLAPYYGRNPSPAWEIPEMYNCPKIKTMSKKVRVEVHPDTQAIRSSRVKNKENRDLVSFSFVPTTVEIRAKGRKFTAEAGDTRDGLDNPLTDAEIVDKFKRNASYSMLETTKTEEIAELVAHLDELSDVTYLTKLITVD